MTWKKDWENSKNILCIRPDNLGDVIMMTPVFRGLKETFGNVKVTLLTSSEGKKAESLIPDLDDVLVYDAPWIESERAADPEIASLVTKIRAKKFDGTILMTNFSQNAFIMAMICYLAKIPKVLGYSREHPGHLITHWVPETEPFTFPQHGVERQLKLVEKIGVKPSGKKLGLRVDGKLVNKVKKKLVKRGVNMDLPLLVLHPGASLSRRQYPEKYFSLTCKEFKKHLPHQILITGNTKEAELVGRVRKSAGKGTFSITDFTFEEFVALIKLSEVVVSNNTSPVHVASALQKMVVVLYARSNPEHTPWKTRSRVLYFDIPEKNQTRNTILQKIIPKRPKMQPMPSDILQAVIELISGSDSTELPDEIVKWNSKPILNRGKLRVTRNSLLLNQSIIQ